VALVVVPVGVVLVAGHLATHGPSLRGYAASLRARACRAARSSGRPRPSPRPGRAGDGSAPEGEARRRSEGGAL